MPKGDNNQGGRKPLYKPEYVQMVREMSAHGWTDFDIGRAFGVDQSTVWRWRRKYPEFAAASQSTEQERLDAVRRSLFARATGYSHGAVKIVTSTFEGQIMDVKEVPYVEHYPPDVAAIKYYLNNKSAGEFAERQEVEQSGGVTVRVVGGLPGDDAVGAVVPKITDKKEES